LYLNCGGPRGAPLSKSRGGGLSLNESLNLSLRGGPLGGDLPLIGPREGSGECDLGLPLNAGGPLSEPLPKPPPLPPPRAPLPPKPPLGGPLSSERDGSTLMKLPKFLVP